MDTNHIVKSRAVQHNLHICSQTTNTVLANLLPNNLQLNNLESDTDTSDNVCIDTHQTSTRVNRWLTLLSKELGLNYAIYQK